MGGGSKRGQTSWACCAMCHGVAVMLTSLGPGPMKRGSPPPFPLLGALGLPLVSKGGWKGRS